MKRSDVYARLDCERSYQERVWGPDGERRALEVESVEVNGQEVVPHSVGDWIVYMDHYLSMAKQTHAVAEGNDSLHDLRKVVALGVACFEQHGCPERS